MAGCLTAATTPAERTECGSGLSPSAQPVPGPQGVSCPLIVVLTGWKESVDIQWHACILSFESCTLPPFFLRRYFADGSATLVWRWQPHYSRFMARNSIITCNLINPNHCRRCLAVSNPELKVHQEALWHVIAVISSYSFSRVLLSIHVVTCTMLLIIAWFLPLQVSVHHAA